MTQAWYVARTKTGREVTASVSVAEKGYQVFLPVELVWVNHARQRRQVSRPLFPRYLFVAFDPASDTHGEINWCRGVANRGLIVDAQGKPLSIPESVITRIRGDEAELLARAGQVTTGLKPGERFQIQRGHASISAMFIGEEKGKVMAFVDMMGRHHIQTFDYSEVMANKLLDSHAA